MSAVGTESSPSTVDAFSFAGFLTSDSAAATQTEVLLATMISIEVNKNLLVTFVFT